MVLDILTNSQISCILNLTPSRISNKKVRNIVMRKIIRHIHKVWCSAKKELTEYVIDWLAHMINGEKVPTALYLKSLPGTDKSIICEFILNKVLGPQMVYKTSDPDQVAGKFNSAIAGKLLLYLEEMPKKSNLEWTAIADRFKALIDPGRIDINEKGKPICANLYPNPKFYD